MLDTVKDIKETRPKMINNALWGDDLMMTYYNNYYENLTSKQLDREFNNDISMLVNVLSKLPEHDRKKIIDVLARVIEFYFESKIEKEIEFTFHKLLKF